MWEGREEDGGRWENERCIAEENVELLLSTVDTRQRRASMTRQRTWLAVNVLSPSAVPIMRTDFPVPAVPAVREAAILPVRLSPFVYASQLQASLALLVLLLEGSSGTHVSAAPQVHNGASCARPDILCLADFERMKLRGVDG